MKIKVLGIQIDVQENDEILAGFNYINHNEDLLFVEVLRRKDDGTPEIVERIEERIGRG